MIYNNKKLIHWDPAAAGIASGVIIILLYLELFCTWKKNWN